MSKGEHNWKILLGQGSGKKDLKQKKLTVPIPVKDNLYLNMSSTILHSCHCLVRFITDENKPVHHNLLLKPWVPQKCIHTTMVISLQISIWEAEGVQV